MNKSYAFQPKKQKMKKDDAHATKKLFRVVKCKLTDFKIL
jgi:hypothetical protein